MTTALTLTLASAPGASAAVPPSAAAPSFSIWFNVHGTSPKADLAAGEHRIILDASCDGDFVGAQLYHVTWGVDRKVGNVLRIPCHGRAIPQYQLSGGEYYFYFLSGVDNTHITGDWRQD
ncbi:hypothetical protein STRCI_008357 [Streptomyces cinnabarinus]|uniref:Uncharacterized protein n=1 Tax=Streptomyces cinnabarinus TaxID=67287 RepID=A0ABY7KQ95_9ACTN|nr:hypothetical protein [Streptomyces cinnabarinus]WAZ26731.1 hypothetical protein STRCI_008357 [Streptomyces cinnabarinus]